MYALQMTCLAYFWTLKNRGSTFLRNVGDVTHQKTSILYIVSACFACCLVLASTVKMDRVRSYETTVNSYQTNGVTSQNMVKLHCYVETT